MAHRQYTAQYKAKIVLEVLQGEKELGEIASENNLNPNMVRNWKREFLENAAAVFEDPKKQAKEAKKKETAQRKETARMLKTNRGECKIKCVSSRTQHLRTLFF